MNAVSGPQTGVPAPKFFISYRREETSAHAGRLYDSMVAGFGEGNVFMDVDLAPGIDFVERITEAVASCHVLILVMGPRWASGTDADGAIRIADPDDFVRLEVETALERADVTVIPVLVGGARMPDPDDLPPGVQPITRRNALELSDGRWRYDVGRLMTRLEELLADTTGISEIVDPPPTPTPTEPAPARILAEGVGLAALAGLIGGGLADSIFDVGLPDGQQVLKRVATWIPVAIAISLWLTLRVAKQSAVAQKVVLAVAVGAVAAAASGALSFLPEEKSTGLTVAAFAVLGAGFGGIVGALWVPRRVAVGFAVGLAAGVLAGLVVPTGDWAPVLAVGLRALLFVGFALIALLVAGPRVESQAST